MERQHKSESQSEKEKNDMREQYNSFKEYAFDLIDGVDMTKKNKAIKAVTIVETAVCLECHRRYKMPKEQIIFLPNLWIDILGAERNGTLNQEKGSSSLLRSLIGRKVKNHNQD